jgi:hypothetical protein
MNKEDFKNLLIDHFQEKMSNKDTGDLLREYEVLSDPNQFHYNPLKHLLNSHISAQLKVNSFSTLNPQTNIRFKLNNESLTKLPSISGSIQTRNALKSR